MLFGLPAHPLLVHFAVASVPVAALVSILTALWPAARRRLGIITPILAGVALVCTAVAQESGEWLQEQLPASPLIERHADLGATLTPIMVGLFLITAADWTWRRYWAPGGRRADARAGRGWRAFVPPVLAVLTVAAAVAATVMVVLIGDAGAVAVWTGRVPTP